MVPITLTCSLDAADDDGVAQNQTPSGAGNLTLNGALVSGGVAVLTGAQMARQVLVTTAADESGKTLTIYGTAANGLTEISETITGPDATTGTTTNYFRTVTRVAVSAAFTGNVKVGTNGVGSSRVVPLDYRNDGTVAIGTSVSGTVNYDIEHTYDEIGDSTDLTWFDHASIANKTAAAEGSYTVIPRALRVKINSGTGTVTANILQAN